METIDKALVSEIADRSGAGAVVVGSIYKSGQEIRIDVHVGWKVEMGGQPDLVEE